MDRIGIIPNLSKDIGGVQTYSVVSKLMDMGIEPLLMREAYDVVNKGTLLQERDFFEASQLILVLGGDGTLLQVARQSAKYSIPIIGINMGRLGFLTEVESTQLNSALDALLDGKYSIEKRMMLRATVIRSGEICSEFVALNDIAVAKSSFARIIHLKVHINDNLVNYYTADGILVSSPTGSTAYSLSAGGPIISPAMECLLLTPICPHTLNARPIVTSGNDRIKIEVTERNEDILLTVDGQEGTSLKKGDLVVIDKANCETHLARIKQYDFFNLLNEKLSERTPRD